MSNIATTKAPAKAPAKAEAAKTYTSADFERLSHDYQVPVSEGTIKGIIGDGEEGASEQKYKAFEGYLNQTAQGLYPTLAPQIAAGLKTAYLMDPYKQVGKQVLGENFEPDFIGNSNDRAALEGGHDPASGRPVPMTMDEWTQHLRKTPAYGWGYTKDAHEKVGQLLSNLHSALQSGGGSDNNNS